MERTADFCNHIASIFAEETDGVFHDATALDTTVDVFDPHPSAGNLPVLRFLLVCEVAAPWFFRRHTDFDPVERKCEKAKILHQSAA